MKSYSVREFLPRTVFVVAQQGESALRKLQPNLVLSPCFQMDFRPKVAGELFKTRKRQSAVDCVGIV